MPSWFWFFAKLVTLIIVFIWVRGTLPRLRVDQLMSFAWKFMLPMALFNLVIAAIWSYSANVGLWLQWLLCAALTVGAYLTFAKLYVQARPNPKRVYRFAD
jgi:NADH-quinone oxidoreductase subunit H